MNIRPATLSDVERCASLDASFATQYVWQTEQRISSSLVDVGFRRIRIPRQLDVAYPGDTEALFGHWQRRECFLAARQDNTLIGYLDLTVHGDGWQGWIEHLVVHRPYRRLGVASALLEGAEQWAGGSQLRRITVAIQAKNDPAISLLLSRGYHLRGYLDRYFRNGDMALFYTCSI